MIASARTAFHFWSRAILYGTPLGALARRLRQRVRQRAAVHETTGYWNAEIGRLYRRPNLNGRVSGALRHTTAAVLLRTCGFAPRSALDIGCAYGDFADTLATFGTRRYVGVDLSEDGIADARREAPNRTAPEKCGMEFHCADLREFSPRESDRFDLIMFSEVLKYLDVDEAEREIARYARWLAPEGVFCVVLTDDPKCHAIFRRLARGHEWIYGTVYQQQPNRPRFRLTPDRANPAYVIGLFRAGAARARRKKGVDHERVR
jgi:SAM-dependent methyltransferase